MPDVLKCSQRSVVQAMAQRYDKNQVEAKLLRWEKFLGEFRLPEWEALPRIELYMDQVIALLASIWAIWPRRRGRRTSSRPLW